MNYRAVLHARNLFFFLLYITALALAAVLVYETLLLTRQVPSPFSGGGVVMAEPTSTAPALLGSTAMSANPPTPVPTVPLLELSLPAEQQFGYHPKTGRYIAAWLPPSFSGGARASFEANKDIIDEISPFWYTTDSSGRLYGNRDDELVRIAHENNVLVIPTIHNVGDYEAVVAMLLDPQRRTNHIQHILNEVLAHNYDGIDIDYESLDPGLREEFSAFIIELADALHSHNKMLTVAVHAKDSDYGGLGGYQDWAVMGQYVDRLRIMTYDYHWRGSGPGPVAPLYWIQSVAEYAQTVVDPSKIVIGVPFYGYDWPESGGPARALPWGDIEDLIEAQGLTVDLRQRDDRGLIQESRLFYETEAGRREVWFMTDQSLASKIDLVQEMDLAGIAIWQLGYEKPEYWEVIRSQLVEDPVQIQREINQWLPEH